MPNYHPIDRRVIVMLKHLLLSYLQRGLQHWLHERTSYIQLHDYWDVESGLIRIELRRCQRVRDKQRRMQSHMHKHSWLVHMLMPEWHPLIGWSQLPTYEHFFF